MGDDKTRGRGPDSTMQSWNNSVEHHCALLSFQTESLSFNDARKGGAFGSARRCGASKGSMLPLKPFRGRLSLLMNQELADTQIRSTCRELIAGGGRVTGRALRRALRERFGVVGRTARVFQILREEALGSLAPEVPADVTDLERRLRLAEAAGAANQARAERAEYREQAHQEHWAMEIDRLREQLRAQPKYAAEIRALQEQVLRLSAELQAARNLLAQRE